MIAVTITIGERSFAAEFYNNESARAIAEQMPFTLTMSDYGSQEKVTDLSFDLPSANTQQPSTIRTGELYLWSGNSLVLFYTTFSNSYSGYVPIGKISDPTGLVDALGSETASVTFN